MGIAGSMATWFGDNATAMSLLIMAAVCFASSFFTGTKVELRVGLWVVTGGLVLLALGGFVVAPGELWGWCFALLPSLLIVHHGLYLSRVKDRYIDPGMPVEMLQRRVQSDELKRVVLETKRTSERFFDPATLMLRYGVPAASVFLVGLTVFYGLNPTTPWGKALKDLISAPTLDAARFGAVGAYLYVVLMLGQRGFQHDITSGAALWTSITLATGPLLSAVLARAWVGQGGGTSDSAWAVQTLYFVAGLSPRYVVDSIEALGKRLFFTRDSAPVNPRSPPLSLVMGMVPPIVDRLSEEGIYDVAGLSMADPQRLLRNTNFDKRQILDWIDQAILLRVLPTSAEALMNAGVSGAIDLVRYVSESSAPAHDVPAKGGPHESAPVAATVVPPPTRGLPLRGLAQLAERAGLTEELLWDCAVRLSEDTQVRIVWLLYQLDSD